MEDDGSLLPGRDGKSKLMTEIAKVTTSSSAEKVDDTCIVFDAMYVINKMEPKPFAVKSGAELAKVFMDYVENGQSFAACRVALNTNLSKISLKTLLLNDESKGYLESFLAEEECKHFNANGKTYMVTAYNKTTANSGGLQRRYTRGS